MPATTANDNNTTNSSIVLYNDDMTGRDTWDILVIDGFNPNRLLPAASQSVMRGPLQALEARTAQVDVGNLSEAALQELVCDVSDEMFGLLSVDPERKVIKVTVDVDEVARMMMRQSFTADGNLAKGCTPSLGSLVLHPSFRDGSCSTNLGAFFGPFWRHFLPTSEDQQSDEWKAQAKASAQWFATMRQVHPSFRNFMHADQENQTIIEAVTLLRGFARRGEDFPSLKEVVGGLNKPPTASSAAQAEAQSPSPEREDESRVRTVSLDEWCMVWVLVGQALGMIDPDANTANPRELLLTMNRECLRLGETRTVFETLTHSDGSIAGAVNYILLVVKNLYNRSCKEEFAKIQDLVSLQDAVAEVDWHAVQAIFGLHKRWHDGEAVPVADALLAFGIDENPATSVARSSLQRSIFEKLFEHTVLKKTIEQSGMSKTDAEKQLLLFWKLMSDKINDLRRALQEATGSDSALLLKTAATWYSMEDATRPRDIQRQGSSGESMDSDKAAGELPTAPGDASLFTEGLQLMKGSINDKIAALQKQYGASHHANIFDFSLAAMELKLRRWSNTVDSQNHKIVALLQELRDGIRGGMSWRSIRRASMYQRHAEAASFAIWTMLGLIHIKEGSRHSIQHHPRCSVQEGSIDYESEMVFRALVYTDSVQTTALNEELVLKITELVTGGDNPMLAAGKDRCPVGSPGWWGWIAVMLEMKCTDAGNQFHGPHAPPLQGPTWRKHVGNMSFQSPLETLLQVDPADTERKHALAVFDGQVLDLMSQFDSDKRISQGELKQLHQAVHDHGEGRPVHIDKDLRPHVKLAELESPVPGWNAMDLLVVALEDYVQEHMPRSSAANALKHASSLFRILSAIKRGRTPACIRADGGNFALSSPSRTFVWQPEGLPFKVRVAYQEFAELVHQQICLRIVTTNRDPVLDKVPKALHSIYNNMWRYWSFARRVEQVSEKPLGASFALPPLPMTDANTVDLERIKAEGYSKTLKQKYALLQQVATSLQGYSGAISLSLTNTPQVISIRFGDASIGEGVGRVALSCKKLQGDLLGPPMHPSELEEVMRKCFIGVGTEKGTALDLITKLGNGTKSAKQNRATTGVAKHIEGDARGAQSCLPVPEWTNQITKRGWCVMAHQLESNTLPRVLLRLQDLKDQMTQEDVDFVRALMDEVQATLPPRTERTEAETEQDEEEPDEQPRRKRARASPADASNQEAGPSRQDKRQREEDEAQQVRDKRQRHDEEAANPAGAATTAGEEEGDDRVS